MADTPPSPDQVPQGIGDENLVDLSTSAERMWRWIMGAWDFLTPGERMILRSLHLITERLDLQETAMSDLTDKLDAALAQLDSDESGIEAVFAAQRATITSLQNALAASQAGEAADQAELQKALDAVTAANTKLSQLTGIPSTGTTDTGSADASTSDPAAPAEPGVPSDPTDAVTVVGEPDPSAVPAEQAPEPTATGDATTDGWSDAGDQGTAAGTDSTGTPTVS